MRQDVLPRGQRTASRWRRLARAVRQFFYGMTVYEMVRDLERERVNGDRLLATTTVGSLLGIPAPSCFYGLRLLPYLAPQLQAWRRAVARERDLTERCEQDLT